MATFADPWQAVPRRGSLGILALNLALWLLLGVLVSAWCLYYTDWFPAVLGLFGLTGIFAWAAFLANLLREERKKEFQEAFERALMRQRSLAWLAIVFAALLAFAAGHGSLQVESYEAGGPRGIRITKPGDVSSAQRAVLKPLSTHKQLLAASWFRSSWPGPREYHVKVSGLPPRLVEINLLRRTPLVVPSSFLRPVLLVRPSANLAAAASGSAGPLKLVVSVRRKNSPTEERFRIEEYRGNAVW
ncbi:MAG: hypothetical protein ACRD26_10275, partial [Vicinamibacterales bacterium]